MKVWIYFDSSMVTIPYEAMVGTTDDVIEVPDEKWEEFKQVRERYENFLIEFETLLAESRRA